MSRYSEQARRTSITALGITGLVLLGALPATAAPGSGCAAVNRGVLSADITASPPVSRQILLDQGDLLSFATRGAAVALVSGAGAPATLIGGTSASAATFKAPTASSYVFQYAATGGADAHVSVSCTSTYTEAANAAFLDRRKALLNARDPDRLRIDRAATPIANPDKPLSSTVAVDEDGRPKDVEFSVSVSEIAAATHGGKPVEPGIVDFWLEGRMQSYASTSLDIGHQRRQPRLDLSWHALDGRSRHHAWCAGAVRSRRRKLERGDARDGRQGLDGRPIREHEAWFGRRF